MVQIDPPGTWCMNAAFQQLIGPLEKIKTFVEIGPGEGRLSKYLCSKGLSGKGVDFSNDIVGPLSHNLQAEITSGQYEVINADFMAEDLNLKADLVFCFMVAEHIEDDLEFVQRMKKITNVGGKVIIGIPGRKDKWGIEDEISGHYRRYDRKNVVELFENAGIQNPIVWSVGVPVSNLLFGLSNFSISRSYAAEKESLSLAEQTKLSGFRDIPYKNVFPAWVTLFVNKLTMQPFTITQRLFYNTNLGLSVIGCGGA